MAKKKILIVDDEEELVRAVQIRLIANNYEAIVAYDGLEGLESAQRDNPDLIILDILMPNMDGYQTLDKLKENKRTKSIPVIMLTAKGQVEDVTKAAGLGAIDYIVKPFSHITLLEKIHKVLE